MNSSLFNRIVWFVGLWFAGVAGLGLVAAVIRLVLPR
jgi:hypothetical protein